MHATRGEVSVSEFKVVNPATNETEREFAAATDAEVELETGMVWINSPTGSIADLPFGGTKSSGVGRELGPSGVDEFVNTKLIYTPAPR